MRIAGAATSIVEATIADIVDQLEHAGPWLPSLEQLSDVETEGEEPPPQPRWTEYDDTAVRVEGAAAS